VRQVGYLQRLVTWFEIRDCECSRKPDYFLEETKIGLYICDKNVLHLFLDCTNVIEQTYTKINRVSG
jgi:hypothetical protein